MKNLCKRNLYECGYIVARQTIFEELNIIDYSTLTYFKTLHKCFD